METNIEIQGEIKAAQETLKLLMQQGERIYSLSGVVAERLTPEAGNARTEDYTVHHLAELLDQLIGDHHCSILQVRDYIDNIAAAVAGDKAD